MPRQDIESEKIPLTEESQEQKVSLLQSSTAKIEDETGTEEADCDDEAELVKASRLVKTVDENLRLGLKITINKKTLFFVIILRNLVNMTTS